MFAFSKAKTLAQFPCNPSILVRGSSHLWRLFHENAHGPWFLFLLLTMSHKTTMCACFVFFLIIIEFFMLIWKLFKPSKTPLTASKPRQTYPNPSAGFYRWIKPYCPRAAVGSCL
jgi:hypothetical protein